jgi:antitoxin MazE
MGLNRMFKLVDQQQGSMVASPRPRQSLRRWGNSLGVRLPAAISREAGLQDNQTVELRVVAEGVLIRPVEPRLTLAERLAAFAPMEGEATEAMAWDPVGAEANE